MAFISKGFLKNAINQGCLQSLIFLPSPDICLGFQLSSFPFDISKARPVKLILEIVKGMFFIFLPMLHFFNYVLKEQTSLEKIFHHKLVYQFKQKVLKHWQATQQPTTACCIICSLPIPPKTDSITYYITKIVIVRVTYC